jgi:PPK2 family polyphosphate:nucleotide phosphotransferase
MERTDFLAPRNVKLNKSNPADTGKLERSDDVQDEVARNLKKLFELHYQMFAEDKHSLLIILQGIDASGKDGVSKHLFAGFNPQGCSLHSFKKPSEEELEHDFLWRAHRQMPKRGNITIFNRSYYEEVTTVKVHPEYLNYQRLPDDILNDGKIFERRYEQINNFEKMLSQNGMVILKFFLHISKDKQRERLQERLDDHTKHWKFDPKDIEERKYWDDYMKAFEEMMEATNTTYAPWYIVPSDKKWYRNYAASSIVVQTLSELKMEFPKIKSAKDITIV